MSWWRKKRRLTVAIAAFLLGFWITACGASGDDSAEGGKPLVVTTSTVITDWAAQVGGDAIELRGILKPGVDPHVYEPVPADSVAFEEADLILYNGYNLEPGLIRMMNSAGANVEKLAVGEVVSPLEMDKEGEQVPDPHVWGNVENVITMTEAIRDALIQLLPDREAAFTDNSDRFTADLARLHTWIGEQIATIPADQRKLVTTHDAFEYYAQTYGLDVVGTLIGISTEEQPSAQTVQKLVESIKATGVPAIFAETTINPQLITTVAEESGIQLSPQQLYSDSLGAPGSNGDSYIKMMVANTQAIVEALGGRYTPFEVRE
ncbi:zinc ABC transporter substrate-binding protein [Oscillatoria sp. FACHB-1407]|uniref:metal ABC transporter solute-binding protein, Zn/Mn family n=1 Tax=Oscillatoria sp. FACHB-1407 TaxID=2692847 RepID=UPI0016869DE0|nr:zinc ABC transporter substrate-binding protein [Oscillatoria sp. FACHB-1407]MBD2462611.1 zinc ABC transporter substrate-binding protein [Oscillatoria sp. FACHB-1407]